MKPCYDVVIIGAGPAGIAAATSLQAQGITDILLLDREKEAGGVPRHCQHPTFGSLVYKRPMNGNVFAEKILKSCKNIEVLTQATVVSIHQDGVLDVSTSEGLHTVKGKRVIIATGVRETPRHPRLVSGLRPLGVLTVGALQQFIYLTKELPCRTPVIVGTDLVSFSALWTLRNAGVKCIAMIEENPRITAYKLSELFAKLLGVKIYKSTTIESINGIERVESITLKTGRDNAFNIPCDGIIFSGEFVGEHTLIRNSHLKLKPNTGCPLIDQYGRCSDNIYYATGNMTHPADMGDQCYLEGLKVGKNVADSLQSELYQTGEKLEIHHDERIKFTMPSCIDLNESGYLDLNVRVSSASKGIIQIIADGNVIYEKVGSYLPHRKINLKKVDLSKINATTKTLSVELKN